MIAHEWGHGTIFATAGWSRDTTSGRQYHEGWADVISYLTEWYREPGGDPDNPAAETADWTSGEDRDSSVQNPGRRVDEDDGLGGFSYHESDPPGVPDDYGHYGGHKLAVAYKLSSMQTDDWGNFNPVCTRLYWLDACDIDVPTIGYWKAGEIFFRVLTVYSTFSSDWYDFADLAKQAARDLYGSFLPPTCDDAVEEQRSVADAFAAIGYPGTPGLICTCEPWPLCEGDPED